MSYDWLEFLQLAQGLSSRPDLPGPRDAALRSAVSRAYYAAYHSALEPAMEEGFDPNFMGNPHQGLQKHYRTYNPNDQIRKRISSELQRLHEARIRADYRSDLRARPETAAESAIKAAQQILELLSGLR